VLDELLAEAFATVREACRRLVGTTVTVTRARYGWNMVPYDVQLIGGIQLHRGRIAENGDGEGKTLVATLPLYLNALPGKGAHLVTVTRTWPVAIAVDGHVYRYLGLKIGCLDDTEPGLRTGGRRTGATHVPARNNEFGFDYLARQHVVTLDQRVQRGHVFAIRDEVDSVLVTKRGRR